MSVTTSGLVPSRHGGPSVLWHRQLDSYPNTAARVFCLAITVLATITLYYELYVSGAVSTLLLAMFILGLVEGICLVATPALIRDFSPQVGRATAMGFWTSGRRWSGTIPATTHWP